MELKDVILSTLSEISEDIEKSVKEETQQKEMGKASFNKDVPQKISVENKSIDYKKDDIDNKLLNDDLSWVQEECQFLENLRERLLVLFEGFQSPNNKSVESKIDLTLNFLEYLLALLDERITKLKKL